MISGEVRSTSPAKFGPASEEVIWSGTPAERPTLVVGDINGDGNDELVIPVRRPDMMIYWYGRGPGGRWSEHVLDPEAPPMGVGGVLVDLNGDGKPDLISGNDNRGTSVYWWEQPTDARKPWTRRVAFDLPGNRTHDMLVADFDGDGRQELVVWNQGAFTILHVPLPENPRKSPWPSVTPIAEGVKEQALAVADLDGDGLPELVAGSSWYKRAPNGSWSRHVFTTEFRGPRVAAADFDGDGRAEIAMAESDGSFAGINFGRVAVFKPKKRIEDPWQSFVLYDRLMDPRTMQVADFDGDGRPDIYTGDMGIGDWTQPASPVQRLFLNRGTHWDEVQFGKGKGTHEAAVIHLDGRLAILGKPFKALVNVNSARPAGADDLTLWRW